MANKKIILCLAVAMAALTSSCALTQQARSALVKGSNKIQAPEATASESPAPSTNVAEPMIAGEWIVTEAGSTRIVSDVSQPYVNFNAEDGRFYASDGCNIINGLYGLQGDVLTFGNVITTMMLCPETDYRQRIDDVLKDGVSVIAVVEEEDYGSTLSLFAYPASRSTMLTPLLKLHKQNLDELNGEWRVYEIGDRRFSNEGMNVFLDMQEKAVHGNTGCNYFNGQVETDSFVPNSIAFSQMAVTMMLCPNVQEERMMLVALEETVSYRMPDADTLQFFSDEGKLVMTLKRAAI